MRKIILAAAVMTMPLSVCAQSVWERQSHASNGDVQVTRTDPNKKYIDQKITLNQEGKVVFSQCITVNGKSQKDIMEAVMIYGNDLVEKATEKYPGRSIAQVIDKEKGLISVRISDEIVFSSKILGKDFSRINYNLIFTCNNNEILVEMQNITYDYEEQRKHEHLIAEEIIIDDIAVNRNKNKLERYYGKFRRATIEYRDNIFREINETFEIK